jgi:hypothetical protein
VNAILRKAHLDEGREGVLKALNSIKVQLTDGTLQLNG